MNPFLANRLNTADIKTGLSEIQSDINAAQEKLETCERSGGADAEMHLVLSLSGLEIKLQNFANDLRKKLL